MTALDQAFIKAFTRQNTSPLPVSPRAAVPAPKQAFPPAEVGRVERDVPKPKAEDPRRALPEEPPCPAASFSSPAPVAVASPQAIQPSLSAASPTRAVPLSATLDGVWAALGRPPRVATGPAKPEIVTKDADEADTSSYCSIIESAVCTSSEPLASYFSATTIEPTFFDTRESNVEESRPTPAVHQSPVGRSSNVGSPVINIGPVERAMVEPVITERAVAAAVESPRPPVDRKTEPLVPEAAPETVILHPAAAATEPTQREFKPGWQVDYFTWPKVCRQLIARAPQELDRLADALLAANSLGQKVLVIGGCCRGEGATTLLLCAARRLAERGIKSVMVDADLNRPRLAKRLCLQPQFGWNETSDAAGRSLDQAIVEATANNVALLPAREPPAESGRPIGDSSRLPICLDTLRDHYDMVLVDLGPLEDAGLYDLARAQEIAQMIDAVVLVHNDRLTSEDRLTTLVEQLAAAGIKTTGIVENFVPED